MCFLLFYFNKFLQKKYFYFYPKDFFFLDSMTEGKRCLDKNCCGTLRIGFLP